MIETPLATGATTAALEGGQTGSAGEVDPADAARFEAMLHPPEAAPPAVETVAPTIESPATLGDRVLAGIDQMRTIHHERVGEIRSSLEGARLEDGTVRLEVQDLMRLQMDLMRVVFQEDLLSKIVGRTTQNVDSLLRGQ